MATFAKALKSGCVAALPSPLSTRHMGPHPATTVLPTHTPELFAAAVNRACDLLVAGELVALPTETVYGLAANAFDANAVARIFAVKGRPGQNPLIVHVASLDLARRCASEWPAAADALAHAFWPGPLTVVVAKADCIPMEVTAGGNTVGLRWPAHPFTQAVIRLSGLPLAAPSANLSARTSPTTAAHVVAALAGRIPLIVDGGPCHVGIESTVIDLTDAPPRLLRLGMIHEESLRAVVGEIRMGRGTRATPLRSPGMLQRHYAPRARLRLLRWNDEADLCRQLAQPPQVSDPPTHVAVIAHTHIPSAAGFLRVSVIPHDPEAFARAIYAELHRCDEAGARSIVVEELPDGPAWQALADRLHRASIP